MGHPLELFVTKDRSIAERLICMACGKVVEDAIRLNCKAEHEICESEQLRWLESTVALSVHSVRVRAPSHPLPPVDEHAGLSDLLDAYVLVPHQLSTPSSCFDASYRRQSSSSMPSALLPSSLPARRPRKA